MTDELNWLLDCFRLNGHLVQYCTARRCSPLRRKFMECSIINQALSLLIKHLVIDQRQKAPNLSAFHWSPHGSLVSIGQHFFITRVIHIPKTSVITESDLITSYCSLCRPCIAAIASVSLYRADFQREGDRKEKRPLSFILFNKLYKLQTVSNSEIITIDFTASKIMFLKNLVFMLIT